MSVGSFVRGGSQSNQLLVRALLLFAIGLEACHSPGLYTSARPIDPGALTTGVAVEPVVALKNEQMTDIGPSMTALLRLGTTTHSDVGARFNANMFGWDVKLAPYVGERLAIAIMPGGRVGRGVWFHAPALVSFDVTTWLRIFASTGVSLSHRAYAPAGSTTLVALSPIPVDSGARPDGWHGRIGAGLELHTLRGLGVTPEVTYLQSVEAGAFSSIFFAMGITFGRFDLSFD